MLEVLTERVWGPAVLNNLWIDEWWEAEQEFRKTEKDQGVEELADMTILLLTLDSFNPNLLSPSQIYLLKLGWDDTVKSYCDEIGLGRESLIPIVEKKIIINRERNPAEAFTLVAGEDMHTSKIKMEQNWQILKKKRDKISKWMGKKDWWKKCLYVDERGWMKEVGVQ